MGRDAEVMVRRASTADLESVGQLGARLIDVHYAFDHHRFMRPGPDSSEGYAWFLGSELDSDDSLVLAAELDGRVVGYLYAGIEARNWKELRERAGFVHDIFLDESVRGSGAAEALMSAAFDWMRGKGVPRVLLWTAAPNHPARRLFERLGFRATMTEMTKELA